MPGRKWYFWSDPLDIFSYHNTPESRRRAVLFDLDSQGFVYLVVIVAGLGFLTDAYDIFSSNFVLPMLKDVYGHIGLLIEPEALALNIAVLAGSMVGQVVFGIYADLLGRSHVYGIELLITITATVCLTMSAVGMSNPGSDGPFSMDIFGWLFLWRLIIGVGVGVEYPLSAVITSEFASTKHRGRMLAVVFSSQTLGQAVAATVAIICTKIFQFEFDPDSGRSHVDRLWRLIQGLGAIPAALALFSRFRIPESARYVLDIEGDTMKAESSVRELFQLGPPNYLDTPMAEHPQHGHRRPSNSAANASGAQASGSAVAPNAQTNGSGTDQAGSTHQNEEENREPRNNSNTPLSPALPNGLSFSASIPTYRAKDDGPSNQMTWTDFQDYIWNQGGLFILLGTSISWFCMDFAFYGLGLSVPHVFQGGSDMIYDALLNNSYDSLIIQSVGAVSGSAIMIAVINKHSRKSTQFWGFVRLAVAFIIIGAACRVWDPATNSGLGLLVTSRIIIHVFFNWGPNTTTFVLPAEIFPTRFRCTCYGISAAVGKLGSVLAQVFVYFVSFGGDGRLGYSSWPEPGTPSYNQAATGDLLLVFALFMIVGAVATYVFIPETATEMVWEPHRRLEALGCGLDSPLTRWVHVKVKEKSLEEVAVAAEDESRELQDRFMVWYRRLFRC